MKSFLAYVAQDIISKYGNHLARVAIVFPNKRASLFLNDHLARLSSRPIWSPAYITISELFRKHATCQVADSIKLVCDLHRCFTEQTGIDEALDHFYGWGMLLLSDFDDIDKNMADANRVFANLRDLHEYDTADYLSEEQKAAIRRFFSNFSEDHNSLLKERFLRLWSHMGDIYQHFNDYLRAQGQAYEGALYRQVVEQLESEGWPDAANDDYDTYIFVGFNMLQQVEQRLFTYLKKQGKARFYWDFDHYYMEKNMPGSKENDAGHYISQYLADFPNELPIDDHDIYGCFTQPKHISYVSAPTENIQARYASQWLREQQRYADGRETAIVLCNEGLLQTTLHCLPDEVQKVNITTGYPLAQTPVASFVSQLYALQTQGYVPNRDCFRLRHVNAVLRHPYMAFISDQASALQHELNANKTYYPDRQKLCLDEGTQLLFGQTPQGNEQLLSWLIQLLQMVSRQADCGNPLLQESVFRAYTLVNRLESLVSNGTLQVDSVTLGRLLAQLFSATSIPFHGEPAEGLQIMGVLETRNIDFRHVLLLSCNEGNMPRGVSDTSFIPYNIRKAYGLTTIDHKVGIYSYYFHRLLQRAEDVTILYNNATTDGQTGEMSRFMLQLMVESPHQIVFQTLRAGQRINAPGAPHIVKSPEIVSRLLQRFSSQYHSQEDAPLLTPTAINRYLRCPLQFYYNYVCGLREPDNTEDDTIDNRIFGNIFHEASYIVYNRLIARSRHITANDIDELLRERVDIERAVDEAFRKEQISSSLNGLQLINREVIIHYLILLLEQDRKLTPFDIVGLECDVIAPLTVNAGTLKFDTTVGGRIDRLDQVRESVSEGLTEERLRVVDYKTGSKRPTPFAEVEAIFQPDNLPRHSDYYLQTLLYASLVRQSKHYNPAAKPVSPALLFIQHPADDPVLFLGKDRINDVERYRESFESLMEQTVSEIFDPEKPFVPTNDSKRCITCPYNTLCK